MYAHINVYIIEPLVNRLAKAQVVNNIYHFQQTYNTTYGQLENF